MSRTMKTTSSEKILIHYDKVAAARKIELTHAYAGQLNHVVAEFGKLNEKAKINSIEELKTFFEYQFGTSLPRPAKDVIKALFIEKLIPGGTVNGLPVNPDFIQVPDLSGVFQAIQKCGSEVSTYLSEGNFEVEDCLVKIAEGAEDLAKEYFSIYAETDDEKERLEAAKNLISALNQVCSLMPENPHFKSKINLLGELESIIEFDDEGKFVVNPFFVKQGTVVIPYLPQSMGQSGKETAKEAPERLSDEYLNSLMPEAAEEVPGDLSDEDLISLMQETE